MTELETAPRPKRLSLSEILELVLTRHGDRSSVSLTRIASGEVVIDVKVSGDSVTESAAQAQAELERLHAAYPRRDDRTEPTVSLTRNAKGETQIDVKGSGWEETQAVYDGARMAYPMANGLTAKPGSVAS